MLRKDTLHMIKMNWEPKVPTTDEIRKQVARKQGHLAGSVRMALGKVIGSDRTVMKPQNHMKVK